jgi:hypothetical protein
MAGGAVFKLGSFGNFGVFNQRDAGPHFLTTDGHGRRATEGCNACQLGTATRRPSHLVDGDFSPRRGATMAMIVLSSPATLTGAEEKKTGPSRFIADFLTELTKLSKFRI